MDKVNKVREDLRKLKRLTHSINAVLQAKEMHEKRLAYLKSNHGNEHEIAKVEGILATLDVDKQIQEATALEARYMGIINDLEPIDKTIVIEGYVNGKAYWRIGRDIGYSEDGIKVRIKKIVDKIAKQI